MPEPRTDADATREPVNQLGDTVRYPVNHVLGIIDKPEQVNAAVRALEEGGFLGSEIEVSCGEAAADTIRANTGHTGLTHLAMRLAERLGVSNDEMGVKDRYEQALREGRYVLVVLAPTEDRKKKSADILRHHGAHFVNFFGRFSIEQLRH